MVKDKEFLHKILQLLSLTENLNLNEHAVASMLDPSISSLNDSKLILALLLERKFLLNLIKALLAPGVPTLSMLIQGADVLNPSKSPTASNNVAEKDLLA